MAFLIPCETSFFGDKISAINNKASAFQFSCKKMNNRRIWFWIALFVLVSSFSTAQRHEFGINVGGVNYVGEIGSTQLIQPKHLEIGLIYKRNYNERIGLRVMYSRGKLSGNDLNASELDRLQRSPYPLSFANDYSTLGATIEINYVKFPVGEFGFSWTPYIHAGVNRMIIQDIYFDPSVPSSRASGKVVTVGIPFGVGVKFNFGKSWILAAEMRPQFTFSDNLDGSFPNLEKKPSAEQFSTSLSSDWLVFTGISITYGFGRLPCCRD
jgi:hypothetical protein